MIRFGRRPFARRFLHHAGDREHVALFLADADNAVLIDAVERDFLDGDDIGALADGVRRVDHLRETAAFVLHQHVRQQQRKRFVADELARAPHRMARASGSCWRVKLVEPGLRQIMAQEASSAFCFCRSSSVISSSNCRSK